MRVWLIAFCKALRQFLAFTLSEMMSWVVLAEKGVLLQVLWKGYHCFCARTDPRRQGQRQGDGLEPYCNYPEDRLGLGPDWQRLGGKMLCFRISSAGGDGR